MSAGSERSCAARAGAADEGACFDAGAQALSAAAARAVARPARRHLSKNSRISSSPFLKPFSNLPCP
jgi:hypothetical protein